MGAVEIVYPVIQHHDQHQRPFGKIERRIAICFAGYFCHFVSTSGLSETEPITDSPLAADWT
jgi:hypothetical protein